MDMEQITEALSVFADYINHYYPESRERDTAITKLEEAVFWLTYLISNEEV